MGFQKPNKYPLLIPSFFYIICKKCFKMMYMEGVLDLSNLISSLARQTDHDLLDIKIIIIIFIISIQLCLQFCLHVSAPNQFRRHALAYWCIITLNWQYNNDKILDMMFSILVVWVKNVLKKPRIWHFLHALHPNLIR